MTDIISAHQGFDMGIFDTETSRAANLLSIQLGSLEYAQDIGIDLKYFLSEDFRFQNESFKSYLMQTLSNKNVNVASVVEVIDNLFSRLTFNVSAEEQAGSLIAR